MDQDDKPATTPDSTRPRLANRSSTHLNRLVRQDSSDAVISEEEELREAAEEVLNIILDVDLDGKIRWASHTFQLVFGTSPDEAIGKPIADFVADGDKETFANAAHHLREDVSGSKIVHFSVEITPTKESEVDEEDAQPTLVEFEGQGIMIYDRSSGDESHVMWMIRPFVRREVTIDLPEFLVDSLGDGAEMLASHLTRLAEAGTTEPHLNPPPLPVLCRICERQLTPWWFPKHSELCLQEHQAEAELQTAQEQLTEHRASIVGVLDALEVQRQHRVTGDNSAAPPAPEYKGMAIGAPSSQSSGRSSPASQETRPNTSHGLSHHRARSFAVRRPISRIVELVLDLCDTALEISQPSLKETASDGEVIRTQSPQSESRISQVLQWQSPSSSAPDTETGLMALCDDTHSLCVAKIEAVMRHRRILEYSERIRAEYLALVQDCIDAALQKAAQINAGENSSGDSDTDEQTIDRTMTGTSLEKSLSRTSSTVLPMPIPSSNLASRRTSVQVGVDLRKSVFASSLDGQSAMALALQQLSSGRSPSPSSPARRFSSAVSTRSSSPNSRRNPLTSSDMHQEGMSVAESDAGVESDGSVRSSMRSLPRQARSPSVEHSLSRAAHSRERKRTSLIIPQRARSATRQESLQSVSPLRMPKARIPPSAYERSPVTSPIITGSEMASPDIHAKSLHHRRQSSAASSEISRAALSPRLSHHPPPRAVPPSIKDFEIIKPISKGAFGSVYLAKKKSTGDYFAIKALRKQDMIAKNQVANVKAERAILMFQGESDFVAKLYWTFPSKDYIFLVMEYLNGGDCASLIQSLGALPEDWAKRYLAEVVKGVEHLHSRGIIHRDLKPDNLLIDHKGHLKLTDFGLSRMGLIGRQKRALSKEQPGDILKQGPFQRSVSTVSSRSASFDIGGYHSPTATPLLVPVNVNGDSVQPSYFSLGRESSGNLERKTSNPNSDPGIDEVQNAFRRFSIFDHGWDKKMSPKDVFTRPEEQSESEQSQSQNFSMPKTTTPPHTAMPPPPMALFDPLDTTRRFVGTPDYLAPETINGHGQDEMSDWWSIGCILFEFLFGYPPFHAKTPEQVFENILTRRIAWPEEDEDVSPEAKDLINRLVCLDPSERLGANDGEEFASGGDEVRAHPWFADIDWDNLNEAEPSFVPAPGNVEDTEYFDTRGATVQNFATEFEDQGPSPNPTHDYERPHDALAKVRIQVNAIKRNLMPLHIPPHVRDTRTRRQSEPTPADDFGQFSFKNLPVLEKANKDVIQKLRQEALNAQSRASQALPTPTSVSTSISPPSLDSSPVIGSQIKRTLSTSRGGHHRSASPSNLSHTNSSPSRASQPSSPLVQFSTGSHSRRKASSSASSMAFGSEAPKFASIIPPSATILASSPIPVVPESALATEPSSPRSRSHTIGSSEGEGLKIHHHKRASQVVDHSPSSSDTEDRQKALQRVRQRRGSIHRLSQIGEPVFRSLDILVIEDHPVSRLVMEKLLGKLKCRCIIVQDGAEAMRYAASTVKFDIIMTEYRLPQINGADVARMVRETKNANCHTPIVAVTGYLKDLQAPHHFDALIEKPATMSKLTEVLSRLCQWKPPPGGASFASRLPPLRSSSLRKESLLDESPTSTASSGLPSFPAFSLQSSREDSVSSISNWTDADAKADDRLSNSPREGNQLGALGISGALTPKPPIVSVSNVLPALGHADSAPAEMERRTPRKAPSAEVLESKKKIASGEDRVDNGGDTGDDEDEELGTSRRSRSPQGKQGLERTDSRISPLSTPVIGDSTETQGSTKQQQPGIDSMVIDPPENYDNHGHGLTPPEIFPRDPGDGDSKMFDMDATPRAVDTEVMLLVPPAELEGTQWPTGDSMSRSMLSSPARSPDG